MSTAELIEKIKALPPEQQREVEGFVAQLTGGSSSVKYASSEEVRAVSGRIFEENTELFKKLAQ
ncbi:MAG: hypothetical protein ABIP97_09245 [Chthoniobacterales bacterium]